MTGIETVVLLGMADTVARMGDDYEHVRRVADKFSGDERMAALLHDTVEDDVYSLVDLVEMGFPTIVTDAVFLLTRRATDDYWTYIVRLRDAEGMAADLARAIKRVDAADNLARSFGQRRVKRYERVLTMLG